MASSVDNAADFGSGGWNLNPGRGAALNVTWLPQAWEKLHHSKNKPIASTYPVLKWHAPVVKEDNQTYENNLKNVGHDDTF